MEEQLIKYETAKLAKEKGFDIPCNNYYHGKDLIAGTLKLSNSIIAKGTINTCNQALLQKWLREIHNLIITIDYVTSKGWCYRIQINNSNWSIYFKTYEEALEEGLIEGLKLIEDVK